MSIANPLSLERERMARVSRHFSIVAEYAAGVQVHKIARKYGVAEGTVCNVAHKFGIAKRYGSIESVRQKVLELYRDGAKIKDIRASTGVDRKTVWVIARAAGLPLRRAPNGQAP